MNRTFSEDEKMKSNYAEYIVKKKSDAKLVLRKTAVIVAAAAFFAIGTYILLSIFKLPVALVPLMLAVGVLVWYLWRFTCIEYEYVIAGGIIEFSIVYGERQRRKIEEIKISDIEKVMPYESGKSEAEKAEIKTEYCNSVPSEKLYVIILNASGKRRAIYFNAIKKSLDAIRYYKNGIVDYGDEG